MTILKRLRDATGLNREDFAQLAGVSLARLEKHEQGRHRISLEDAAAYALSLSKKLPNSPSKLLAELAGISDNSSQAEQGTPSENLAPAHLQKEVHHS
ncbi:MAG: helix-turn-helix transcriptional regulator [Deinococcus sp.]|uniref:helix-turn-helix domain-containing protein n=1 Tax=Deinococcus sp. TaxID=47478 RepID=UPI0026DBFE14|nr:helix-turn-helix transcriptional regulator [Deinococcus sp.]MDO4246860.1 helix-turn-helix transcriptional regulator [Deinococcus sp.]